MKFKTNKLHLVSIILVLAMIITAVPMVYAINAEETEAAVPLADKYTEAFGLLQRLEVYTQDEISSVTADKIITRAELAKRLILTMNLQSAAEVSAGNTVFMDIHNDLYKGYINLAYDMGITKGTGDASFEPEQPATLQMAASMMMRALGYTHIEAQAEFYKRALNLGILDGTESKAELTETDAALILYNCLHTEGLGVAAYGDETNVMAPERSWLEIWHGISYVEGIVEATEITALKQGRIAGEGNIIVGGTEIFGVPEVYQRILGYPVRCYYDNTGSRKNYEYLTTYSFDYREVEINKTDVLSFTANKISFYNSKDKKLSMTIDSKADFVYNGKAESLGVHSLDEMKKGYTNIKLLDNNDDGEIDVVFITKATVFAVSLVDAANMKIIGKNSEIAELQKDKSDLYSIALKDGTPVAITDIKEWNVVSVAESFDETYVTVVVSTDYVSGEAKTFYQDEPGYIIVNEQKYEIAKELIDGNEIKIGKTGTFYLSADGIICAVDYGNDGSEKWVWAIGLAAKGSFNDTYEFGCVEGNQAEFKTYEIADKITVDGSSVKEENLGNILPNTVFPEAMIVQANEEGEIIKINTLALGNKENSEENIYKRHKGPESEKELNDGKLWYNNGSKSFHGRFIMATDSVNYAFPTYDKTLYDDMFTVTYKHDEPPYAVTLYSQGTETPVCDFSISMNLSKGGSLPGSETGAVPFAGLGEMYDTETGETHQVLYYLNTANAEVSVKISEDIKDVEMVYSNKALDFDGDGTNDYTASSKMPISEILGRLEKGDLIRLITDQNGLAGIQHLYDISKRQLVQKQGAYCWTTATEGGSDEIRLFAGKLYEIRDDYLRIITNAENYNPVTGVGMEVHRVQATRSQRWNRMMTINGKGDVELSSVSGVPALSGVKQGNNDVEVVMQSMFGDAIFKIFIDYSNSPY